MFPRSLYKLVNQPANTPEPMWSKIVRYLLYLGMLGFLYKAIFG